MCAVLGTGDTTISNTRPFSLGSHILVGEGNKLLKLIKKKIFKVIGATEKKNVIKQNSIKAKATALATLTLNVNDKKDLAMGTQHSRQRNG